MEPHISPYVLVGLARRFTPVMFFFLVVLRCNIALMLLAELVLDQASVDWEEHLPLMLHVIFLGEFIVRINFVKLYRLYDID